MRWPLALLVAGLTALTGCGAGTDVTTPVSSPSIDSLPGAQVGKLAEEQLEAENLEMAVGRVTCPDLAWTVDASVRCVKLSELSDGRRVKIPGTVTVTSTVGGGKLHVALDDKVAEFGVDAHYLASNVTDWVTARTKVVPTTVRCPYLRGIRGATAGCGIDLAGHPGRVRVTVTDVDAKAFRTTYTCSWQVRPKAA
jgi:hypothetical protein